MNLEKAALLAERGRVFLDREEFVLAEESFVQALKEADDPVVRNNLAMTRFLLNKPQAALETLEGVKDEWPNPYRKSLMAQCQVVLGKMAEAKSLVRQAVGDFDKISRMKDYALASEESWRQYTVMVMRAAGATADHRQVLELYKRWQKYHVHWENKYLAGIAAFNLKRFRQAASYWSGLRELPFSHQLQLICVMADHGVVPPFELEYKVVSSNVMSEAGKNGNPETLVAESGLLRIMLLMSVVDERGDEQSSAAAMETLVVHGGQWGRSLGLEFLEAAMIPEGMKMMTAQALVKAGVFAEGEDIPIQIGGETRLIRISQVEVTWEPEKDVLDKYNLALKLRDQGKKEQALEILSELNTGRVIFPPALLVLANLYRDMEKPEKAQMLLETLEKIEPDHPIFLFNLAGFWLEAGDKKKAEEYADRIDTRQANREFKEKVAWLRDAINFDIERSISFYREEKRKDFEERKLPTEPTIARGLRNMPVEWVREACVYWQVGCEYRKDGEAALVSAASSEAAIRRAVLGLSEDERELLLYLLDKGGFARVSAVSRKFGSMEGEGFLGENGPPHSALGRLWLKALVFVGRALINGRNEKIATIPVEMRDELRRLFIGEALFKRK